MYKRQLLLEKGNSLAGIISGFFPNFRFLVRGLADESILQMALFLLTIAAVVAAFLWLAQKIYFSGVVGMGESASRARRMTKEESMKLNRRSTVQRLHQDTDRKREPSGMGASACHI